LAAVTTAAHCLANVTAVTTDSYGLVPLSGLSDPRLTHPVEFADEVALADEDVTFATLVEFADDTRVIRRPVAIHAYPIPIEAWETQRNKLDTTKHNIMAQEAIAPLLPPQQRSHPPVSITRAQPDTS